MESGKVFEAHEEISKLRALVERKDVAMRVQAEERDREKSEMARQMEQLKVGARGVGGQMEQLKVGADGAAQGGGQMEQLKVGGR